MDHSAHLGPDGDDAVKAAHAQLGVQSIEAVTGAWTTIALILAYVVIWLTDFAEGMLSRDHGCSCSLRNFFIRAALAHADRR